MSVAYTTNRLIYQGDGSNVDFPITPMEFESASTIKVYLRDETDPAAITETLLTEGSGADYEITGVDVVLGIPGTGIQTTVAPTADQKIVILRKLELTQEVDLANSGPAASTQTEIGLDRLVMIDQQQQTEINRAVKLANTSEASVTFPDPVNSTVIAYDENGDLVATDPSELGISLGDLSPVAIVNPAAGEVLSFDGTNWVNAPGAGTIGTPTDGVFGNAGGIAGLDPGDTYADGFDKLEVILEKLAPAKPANLSATPLTLSTSYTALEASSGTSHTCTDDTTPTASAADFYDGDAGDLTAQVDGVDSGTRTLSTSDDSGTYGDMTISADEDPYAGIVGREGFWKQLTVSVTPSAPLSVGAHILTLTHSTSGAAAASFYVDNPSTPTISATSASSTGTSSYVSGVPGVAAGQTITVGWTVNGAVSSHYHATRVARVESAFTSDVDLAASGTPASGASLVFSQAVTVEASRYTENFQATVYGYNSKGTSVSSTVTPATTIRIDTASNESARSKSGQGQYPSKGSLAANFGDAFSSTTSLATAGNEELQLLNGSYQYPSATNYSSRYPAGPNYSAISGGSHSTYRWATFNVGSISAASAMTLALNGASGISNITESGMLLYTMVEGSTGWLDANAAYPGVGNPSANGDPAVVVGSSTATSRRITFGAAALTGTVWVRIGFPSGSTKRITGITRS